MSVPALSGSRLLVVEPVNAANLKARNGKGGGKALIVADQLNPGEGQMVGFVEGREAANPYWPNNVPVDAYCACIVENIEFKPPAESGSEAKA
jgi:ethanolamine utilization protein EutN